MSTLIEKNTFKAAYDMACIEAIIDTEKYGRLYISEGFGGVDSLRGGAVRWIHGTAIRVADTDTIESLQSRKWNDSESYYTAMLAGDYGEILNVNGHFIEAMAKSAELS